MAPEDPQTGLSGLSVSLDKAAAPKKQCLVVGLDSQRNHSQSLLLLLPQTWRGMRSTASPSHLTAS